MTDKLDEIARAYEVGNRPIPPESVEWLVSEIKRLRLFFTGEYICQSCWLRKDELREKHDDPGF